jgi:hypothetical protein
MLPWYYAGNSLVEAYWKSVQMPGEGVFVGEPLARPYASAAGATVTYLVEGPSAVAADGQLRVRLEVNAGALVPGVYEVFACQLKCSASNAESQVVRSTFVVQHIHADMHLELDVPAATSVIALRMSQSAVRAAAVATAMSLHEKMSASTKEAVPLRHFEQNLN